MIPKYNKTSVRSFSRRASVAFAALLTGSAFLFCPLAAPSARAAGVTVSTDTSLRDQMNILTSGGTVSFTGGGLNSTLTSAVTLTSNPYVLNPGGAEHVAINGASNVGVFENTGDINLTLSNITIANASGTSAVRSSAGTVNITLAGPGATEFSNNDAISTHGGAVYGQAGISITGSHENLVITNNRTNQRTGGLYVETGLLNINPKLTGTLLVKTNGGGSNGGAFYVAGTGTVMLSGTYKDVLIQGNSSRNSAGGVITNGQGIVVINSTVSDTFLITSNSAAGRGGAIFSHDTATITANGPAEIRFENNIAGAEGGALFINRSAGVVLDAKESNIVFQGNLQGGASGTPNAIYILGAGGAMLDIRGSHDVLFFDPVYAVTEASTLIKNGGGSVLFSGGNTWRGNATINEGALLVNDAALLDTAAAGKSLALAQGAIIGTYATAGSGTIKAETLNLSGILYAGGNASQLHIAGSATLDNITISADLHPGGQSGLTVIHDTATFAGTGTVDLQSMTATSGTFTVLRYDAGTIPAGAFSATLLNNGAPYTTDGATVRLSSDAKSVEVVLPGGGGGPATITVTFDPQGGSVSPTTKDVTTGSPYGTLPTPAKADNTFDGWFTAPGGGGAQVTEATTVTDSSNHTLYAKWNAAPSGPSVTVSTPDTLRAQMNTLTDGGTVNFEGAGLDNVLASAVTLTSNPYTLNPGGAQHVTISGNSAVGVFENTGDINLTLSNITIANASGASAIGSSGGAVNITLADAGTVEFHNNDAVSSHGGAIHGQTGIAIAGSHDNLVITNNRTNQRTGGLYVESGLLDIDPLLTGTLLIKNNGGGGNGGALSVSASGTVKLSGAYNDILIQRNSSRFGGGGAMAAGSGYIIIDSTVSDTFLITSNTASGGNGGAIVSNDGVAITANGPAEIRFENNTASGSGGAIYINRSLPVILDAKNGNIVFQDNKQGGDPGVPNAIYGNASATLDIGGSHDVLFFDPVYTAGDGGGILKNGGGSVLFSGSNYWRGNATITEGALLVNTAALLDTAASGKTLSLAPGAILATYATAGSGTIKAETLNLSGILHATGSASQLHIAGSATLDNITISADLHPGDQSGLTVIHDTATFAGTGTVDLQSMAATSGTFTVLRYDAGTIPAGAFSATLLYQGSPVATPGATVQLSADQKSVQVVIPDAGPVTITVTFDPQGGAVSPTTKDVTTGSPYGTLPTPTKTDNTFDGWFTAPDGGGTQVTETTNVTAPANHTLYARWTPIAPATLIVALDPQGGTVSPTTKNVTVGSPYGTLPTPTKTNNTFDGWFTAATGGTQVTAATTVTETTNHTLYARWTETAPGATITVTFDPQGGAVSPTTKDVTTGSPYGTLPAPTKTSYTFGGWFTAATGGTQVTAATTVTQTTNHTLYARWTETPPTGSVTVTFDSQGGIIDSMTKTVASGQIYGALPSPSKAGNLFAGWWTSPNGDGTQVAPNTIVPAGITTLTLHAKWNTAPPAADGDYLVIDLSGGPNTPAYPVRASATPPPDIAVNTAARTTEIWLRRIQPGSFQMGSPDTETGRSPDETRHTVTFTQACYVGVFEITQKQWQLVMSANPAYAAGDTRPAEGMSYETIRGANAGANWPASDAVDPNSFIGKLRAKTGLPIDLPTEAQWEYAARAGTTTALNNGQDLTPAPRAGAGLDALGRYAQNQADGQGGYTSQHTAAGAYLPNAWGLYDMHGNTEEYCLDWYGTLAAASATDPKGSDTGAMRVTRGGGWSALAAECRSATRSSIEPFNDGPDIGLRLAMPVAETPPSSLTVSPDSKQSIDAGPGTLVFTVKNAGGGSLSWTATITTGDRWAHIASIANDGDGGTITVTCDPNLPGGALRIATLTVAATGADDDTAVNVTIEQAANPGPGNSGSGGGGGALSLPGLALFALLALLRAAKKRR